MSEWMSVKNKIPPSKITVIAYNGIDLDTCIFLHIDDNQFREDYPRISHWMPLPNPPENNNEQ